MAPLEKLTPGSAVKGILPNGIVTVVSAQWFGSDVVELTFKNATGGVGQELLYRDREPALEIVDAGRPWSFDGDGALFRLVSEASRISLAYLFDPVLAVHTSLVDPLPHQITAVYQDMLPRQPLRFLLADDPGAGKTIMAGLLIKELLIRGDVRRCLIVCPGNLVEQWQDELDRRFHLPFEIMTNDKLEAARTGNWFQETSLVIGRLDKLSRDEAVQEKLQHTEWDLVICDEAHKMSASYFGGEVSYTKRYRLGQLLGARTRHFLLMSATPHNGKDEDFQLFLALLDADRFEGKVRDGAHVADVSDLMRRMVKEELLTFEGRPLFPERKAYTVNYTLSTAEAQLYQAVTEYVREEFNRADALATGGHKGTVGFALTILQRRLASSPAAIAESLRRRRERLERRLAEEQLLQRGNTTDAAALRTSQGLPTPDWDDLDDAPDQEVADEEEALVDEASAARTIAELKLEIEQLRRLEALAQRVLLSGADRKWEELSNLLQANPAMRDAAGQGRKLIIFTEHRDTLNYLTQRLRTLLGQEEAVVTIHGGMLREERQKAQASFTQNKDVQVLVATDAAGEGVNLQRAHLMVNYDLPWNPNRLEQRFGRIHRIGQTEVCHLWNLVAAETREGDVYTRLLDKLNEERTALGGRVFDVLGKVTFQNQPLRDLLVQAIRYGDQPEVRARLYQIVDQALDTNRLRDLLNDRALARESMDVSRVQAIRADMERAEARRLQPHFVASFFQEAFRLLGGQLHQRETGRFEVTHVPGVIRARDRQIGVGQPVLPRYERVTFEKTLISVPGKPLADFLCPGHPLLDACIDLILERYRDLLRTGTVLLDSSDPGTEPRVLFYLQHSVQNGRPTPAGGRQVVSKELQFVELTPGGAARDAGAAPYLDYRPLTDDERRLVTPLFDAAWLQRGLEQRGLAYAVQSLVPEHLARIRSQTEERVEKTKAAVHERLTREIIYWDNRYVQLQQREEAGRTTPMNSSAARRRRDDLETRLQKRLAELDEERAVSALPPVALGGALIIPGGLLAQRKGADPETQDATARERQRIEQLAMRAVMAEERRRGYTPFDVSDQKVGYDIESRTATNGRLRFIEVKGRTADADIVTITKNEILTALNKPDDWQLAVVLVNGDVVGAPTYVARPFRKEPDFGAVSVNYELSKLVGGR